MKATIYSVILSLVAACSARATFTETFSDINLVIPDGNPLGIVFNAPVTDIPVGATVSALTVNLVLSGGYDANLYSYLVAPNGTMVTLLYHPGVTSGTPLGNSGSGMNITLADNEAAITANSVLSGGTWAASGLLSGFNGVAANGTWELFFADTVSGGGRSTLNSFSLDITAVPEPTTFALPLFGGLVLTAGIVRHCVSRRKVMAV
jgi:hypothetical protein